MSAKDDTARHRERAKPRLFSIKQAVYELGISRYRRVRADHCPQDQDCQNWPAPLDPIRCDRGFHRWTRVRVGEVHMPAEPSSSPQQRPPEEMLTAAEAARILKVSESWLAKARMRGEGPPFIRLGRSVRYVRLRQWLEDQ